LPDDTEAAFVSLGNNLILTSHYLDDDNETRYAITLHDKGSNDHIVKLGDRGYIPQMFIAGGNLVWLEENYQDSKVCWVPLRDFAPRGAKDLKPFCPIVFTQGESISFVGEEGETHKNHWETNKIWLRQTRETSGGDEHKILLLNLKSFKLEPQNVQGFGGKMLSMAKGKSGYWAVVAGRSHRFLRKFSPSGQCEEERLLANHVSRAFVHGDGLALSLFNGRSYSVKKIDPKELVGRSCTYVGHHDSPLMTGSLSGKTISLKDAVGQSSIWHEPSESESRARDEKIAKAPSLGMDSKAQTFAQREKANWRGRSLFAFPWIGADAAGYQFGFISVPLMDHMQNETLRFHFLYGVDSRFPDVGLSLLTTRFDAAYEVSVFRRQSYNGSTSTQVLYYDERGGAISRHQSFPKLHLSTELGLSSSYFKPFMGPANFRIAGQANEVSASLGYGISVGRVSFALGLSGTALPAEINKTWEYNRVGTTAKMSIPVEILSRVTTYSLGLTTSRTRGKKMKFLKEVYRPLKTFVPGTGGGFNEINVGLMGPGNLTSAQFGDTQARVNTSWTFLLSPIWRP
jgi:hypothetical protein